MIPTEMTLKSSHEMRERQLIGSCQSRPLWSLIWTMPEVLHPCLEQCVRDGRGRNNTARTMVYHQMRRSKPADPSEASTGNVVWTSQSNRGNGYE